MAGEPLNHKRQKDIAVNPRSQNTRKLLAPMKHGLGDLKDEQRDDPEKSANVANEWETLADKYENIEGEN